MKYKVNISRIIEEQIEVEADSPEDVVKDLNEKYWGRTLTIDCIEQIQEDEDADPIEFEVVNGVPVRVNAWDEWIEEAASRKEECDRPSQQPRLEHGGDRFSEGA